MPARVSGLRERPGRRVAVELDGTPWRTLPAEVVVRAGLVPGTELDRERARSVRRELRRAEALGVAARALRARDRSSRELAVRLERAGVGEEEREATVGILERAGLVDDARFASARATARASRGYGNEAIRHDLLERGISAEVADEALAALAPERERAAAIVARRGAGRGTAAFLARRGFAEDAVALAFGAEADHRYD